MTRVDNPVLPGCYPDPSVCRAGEDYYLVCSSFEYLPGLPVFRSRDLVGWEQVGHVVHRPGQLDSGGGFGGIASSGGLFAPTIRHHDGLFWVVCTLVDREDPERGGNFLVTAEDPAGPWSEPVWLDVDGIDPSLLFDEDGRAWVHGTRPARQPDWHDQTEVWLRELDLATRRLTGPEHVLWRGAQLGAVWAEGPHLYRRDGAYYLLAAEGGTEFHHAVCVATAEEVTGPYTGSKANPVLTHRHLGRDCDVVGVGHADLVEGPDGSWWAVLLGMRPYGGYHYNLGRETFLVPVVWEDGWPVFAPGTGRVPRTVEVPFAQTARPAVSGLVPPDDARWTALRRTPREVATPRGVGWELPVRPETLAEPGTPAFLGVRQQHRDLDLRARLGLAGLGVGERAGLVVRQSESDHATLLISRDADGRWTLRAAHRRGGAERVLAEVPVRPSPGEVIDLGLRIRGQEYALFDGAAERVVAAVDGRTLDTVATGGFLGLWLGVHATSEHAPTRSTLAIEHVSLTPRTATDPAPGERGPSVGDTGIGPVTSSV